MEIVRFYITGVFFLEVPVREAERQTGRQADRQTDRQTLVGRWGVGMYDILLTKVAQPVQFGFG